MNVAAWKNRNSSYWGWVLGIILLLLMSWQQGLAQSINGLVLDELGQPLPYVSIGVVGTSRGVTSSEDGSFFIDLGGAGGSLKFSAIGYESEEVRIEANPSRQQLELRLSRAVYTLNEAVVTGGEDPAYRIMREAAARREQYRQVSQPYEVDVYIKGSFNIIDAPEKIFGQEVGDMGGALDSNRAGIIYLSESRSLLQIAPPDLFKETVLASRVSGSPQTYTFNTAAAIAFDLYERSIDYGTTVVSPLAENGPSLYRFELLGARRPSPEDPIIYHIGVKPRRIGSAVYTGDLYIEDESYHLLDASLFLIGSAIQQPGLDTIAISQIYRRTAKGWEIAQRQVRPVMSLLGFRFGGTFTGVYSDYRYQPDWEQDPFGRVISRILPDANQQDTSYWLDRPIPLTRLEQLDYQKKDSIRLVRESPAFRDSVQLEANKLSWTSILGHTFSDWRGNRSLTYTSPVANLGFHPAPGFLLGVGLGFRQNLKPEDEQSFGLSAGLRYGTSDEQFYPSLQADWRLDPLDRRSFGISMGRNLVDYHPGGAVDPFTATTLGLGGGGNALKLYETRYLAIRYSGKLRRPGTLRQNPPWGDVDLSARLDNRRARANTSTFRFRDRGEPYETNLPEFGFNSGLFDTIPVATMLQLEAGFGYTPGQQFLVRPDAYIATGGGPHLTLNLRYTREIDGGIEGASPVDAMFLTLGIDRENIDLKRAGRLHLGLRAGTALWYNGPRYLMDQQLFLATRLRFNGNNSYLHRFLAMPQFAFATENPWSTITVEHNFNGLIWRQLPVLRKLGYKVVVRGAAIAQVEQDGRSYAEFGLGLDNVGFGLFRLLRLDYTWSLYSTGDKGFLPTQWQAPWWSIGLRIPSSLVIGTGS